MRARLKRKGEMSWGNRNKNGRIDNDKVGTQRRHWDKQCEWWWRETKWIPNGEREAESDWDYRRQASETGNKRGRVKLRYRQMWRNGNWMSWKEYKIERSHICNFQMYVSHWSGRRSAKETNPEVLRYLNNKFRCPSISLPLCLTYCQHCQKISLVSVAAPMCVCQCGCVIFWRETEIEQ